MLDQRPTSLAASPAAEAETNDLVRTLISVLTPLERKIVWYRFYGDLATSEIAKRTQMNVVNVREVLSQAMFKMKQAAWE